MTEDRQLPRPRQPTVQAGRGSLFGKFRDDRWDGQSGTVDAPSAGWFGSGGRRRELKPSPGLQAQSRSPPQAVSPPPAAKPRSSSAMAAGPSGLGRLAVPLLILAFALATSSIFLPAIAFIIWLQRRKLFPHFAAPWHDPARVRGWAARYSARHGLHAKPLPAPLANWLRDPPYADPAAFRVWIDQRIAQVFLALCGLILLFRVISALADRPAAIAPGVI